MDVPSMFDRMPAADTLNVEVTAAEDGYAEGRLELTPELSSSPETLIAHGGITYAFADTVGGAAVISLVRDVTPTVDMRIDYLAPATDDLRAEAEVLRRGGSVATVDVAVEDVDGTPVAEVRGVYKTGGRSDETAWSPDGTGRDPSRTA